MIIKIIIDKGKSCVKVLIFFCVILLSACSSENKGDKDILPINELEQYVQWVDQSKLSNDITNYSDIENSIKYALAINKEANQKTFDKEYLLVISKDNTVLKCNNENVEDTDALYIEIKKNYQWLNETHLFSDIPDAVLSIKDGKVIRISDPADYKLKNN